MSELVFATKKTLKQPVGGLIVEAPQEQDYVLGATGPEFEMLVPSGQWHDFLPVSELQRNRHGDTYMCVSFSLNNIHEFLVKRKYNEEINKSDIFLGVGSGTTRGRGNSKRTVADWNRLNGFVLETDHPYTKEMTLDEAYRALSAMLLETGRRQLEGWEFGYKWLPSNGVFSMTNGLKISPLQVDVSGSYKMNSQGCIAWDKGNPAYDHEVTIFGYEDGKCWHVFDSETEQAIKFAWGYPFGGPMIHSVVKKKTGIQLYKKVGQSGIAFKHISEPSLIVFSGGSVEGGGLLLSLYGVSNFSELPIVEVVEWPYPIRHMLNTNPTR